MRKKWEWQGPWNWGKTFPHVLPMIYYIHDKDEHNEYEAGTARFEYSAAQAGGLGVA